MILKTASALIVSLAATGAAMAQSQDLSACDESAYTPPFSTVVISVICFVPAAGGPYPSPRVGRMTFFPDPSQPGRGAIQTSLPSHSDCNSSGEFHTGSWQVMPGSCDVSIQFTDSMNSDYFFSSGLYGAPGFSIFSVGSSDGNGPWSNVFNFDNVTHVQAFE
jgi:hypothetical protein